MANYELHNLCVSSSPFQNLCLLSVNVNIPGPNSHFFLVFKSYLPYNQFASHWIRNLSPHQYLGQVHISLMIQHSYLVWLHWIAGHM